MAVTAVFVVLVAISMLVFVIAAALRKVRDEQAKLSNYTAAQSLHAVLRLAEGGVALHKLSAHPTTIEREPWCWGLRGS